MKKLLLSGLVVTAMLSGCATPTIQHVNKPDVTKPIGKEDSVIQLRRENIFMGGGRTPNVIANSTQIGTLANGDELVWKTSPNSIECISLDYGSISLIEIKFDSTPLPYKCFSTKQQELLKLKHDVLYPQRRAVRGYAFLPVFTEVDKSNNKAVSIKSITTNLSEPTIDLKKSLEAAIKLQFGEKLVESSNKTIDLEVLDYKTGNAGLRWLASSHEGSTLAKVKMTIKENNIVIDTFITRPVISSGGFFTVGADSYIFEEVAEDLYLHMFEPSNTEKK